MDRARVKEVILSQLLSHAHRLLGTKRSGTGTSAYSIQDAVDGRAATSPEMNEKD